MIASKKLLLKSTLNILFVFIISTSCTNSTSNTILYKKSPADSVVAKTKPNYETFKNQVKEYKATLTNTPSERFSDYLFRLLNEDIFYYWKGTTWDFNGTTQQPQTGSIACGYFVTNTLTDLGFDIQRIKLAQAVSSKMINTLCVDIHWFSEFEKLQNYLSNQPVNSVFIVGLDFHTGYLLKDSVNSYFLHSNYINREGVIKERIENSSALRYNKAFMIGSLTANKGLLDKWIKQ